MMSYDVYSHIMLKPMLPGLRLATRLLQRLLSKDTCFHMLVVFLNAIIPNHKLVRVNLRLEWDTD